MFDVMIDTPSRLSSSSPHAGFTLIEVVVAMTVFAIGLLAANMMQSASIKGNSSATAIAQSSSWAAGKMEEIISWPYNDPRLQDDGNPATDDGADSSPDGAYTITWRVTNSPSLANTKTVVVTVTWNMRGTTKASQLTIIKAQAI